MKRITLISSYYYPEDTAIGLYNTQLVDYLQSKGYTVNVITGFPSYPQWKIFDSYKKEKTFFFEELEKAKIYRYKQYVPSKPTFFKRILLIIDFTIGSIINVFKIKHCDIVICVVPQTSTIILSFILKLRTKAKLWCHVQDFEFDAAEQAGLSPKENVFKSVIFKFLFQIERVLLKLPDINSTISYSMLKKLKGKSNKEAFYFPNWIDAFKIDPLKSTQHPFMTSQKFKILYSGNIGEKQDWEFFLLFAKMLENHNAEIILVGDGAKKGWLLEKTKDLKNVQHFEPVEYKYLSNLLCSADLHILFQKKEVVDSVMPSKLLGMMASAKPSLVTGSSKSEVKTIIEDAHGGFYVSNDVLKESILIIESLMSSPQKSQTLGDNARTYIVSKFSKQKVLSTFESKLQEVIEL
ncbi:MAG: glycosyltransferase WbuB [Winogradskyella sp.]|nr:glycosyltransferase WbuB [Winogradskyella sp.]